MTTFEELVAERLGREARIQRVIKLNAVCAYRVEFKDDDGADPLLISWDDLQGAGIPDADLASLMATRECDNCGQQKPIEEMQTVFLPGTGETYQCEQCRGITPRPDREREE